MLGEKIYKLCEDLFLINRSLTGNGVRKTLKILKSIVDDLNIYEVPSGTKCFDWEIPKEWNCNEAYIVTPDGKKICDYNTNNLHLVGYSTPIKKSLSLEELNKHLYSLEELPTAIPYVTSYYKERWGFCISHNERKKLEDGDYEVIIDSSLDKGHLSYGEIIIKGESEKEIFFSTYVCHPSMGNNELSGPCLAIYLAKYIKSLKNRYYTYRIVFAPETIGSICYLSKNLVYMKKYIDAGYILTCVGDNNNYSYLASRYGNTLADKMALHILKYNVKNVKKFSFLERGSDERQYCSAGVDLPICSIMRTKYAEYKEYHTSLDDLDFISREGLNGSYEIYKKIIKAFEYNKVYKTRTLCEPQLGKRGLYPSLSTKETLKQTRTMMNLLAYADGTNSLLDIADILKVNIESLFIIIDKLIEKEVIEIIK